VKFNQKILVSTLCLSILSIFQIAFSQVRLPRLISDGMLLQRDANVKIWGWATADEKITINFRDKTYHTTADKNVNWAVILSESKAGGPYNMEIHASVGGSPAEAWISEGALKAFPAHFDTFSEKIDQLREQYHIPGMSICVIEKHKVKFSRGLGYSDLEEKIPATENTPYHIASLTKPFTAVLIMRFIEAGKLELDSNMADLLKDAEFKVNDMNVKGYENLCQTLKPLINYKGDTHVLTVKHHVTHTAHGVPGEKYRYSGYLFGLLTEVLESVSGKKFDKLLAEEITTPLEMYNTVPGLDSTHTNRILNNRAKPYKIDNSSAFSISRYPGRIRASAGMVSTVLDLAKFDIAIDENRLISESSKQLMFTPNHNNKGERLPYAIGWFVQEYKGIQLIWHYGWQPDSYSSLILKVPKKEMTFILLANSDGASASFNLGEGNVLNSPFARAFLELLIGLDL